MVFYGILDLLAKPVFIFIHLFLLSRLDLTALQLHSGKFTSSAINGRYHDAEKLPRRSNATGITATESPTYAAPTTPTTKNKLFSRRGKSDSTPAGGAGTGRAFGTGATGAAGGTSRRREEELGTPATDAGADTRHTGATAVPH